MTLHTHSTLVTFGAAAMIPKVQSLSFFIEIGPLVAALLVAGRVGAGIGAVLANLRASEQIDAIEVLSVDSFKFLVVPRVVACVLVLPLLTTFMDLTALLGGFLAEHALSHLSAQLFIERAFNGIAWSNFVPPTMKTTVFGFLIGTVSCYYGYTTDEGAEGVGRAATNSVVLSSLLVIVADVVLVKIIFLFFSWERTMAESQPAAIVFDAVSKSFGTKQVLQEVSFSVRQGETVCTSGPQRNRKKRNPKTAHRIAQAEYWQSTNWSGRYFVA